MASTIAEFESRITEEACLAEVMRLRFGDEPCPACDRAAGFAPTAKHRAFSCRVCGFRVYPCQGTVFAKPRPPLTHWFLAAHLAACGELTARSLHRALGRDAPAELILDGVATLEAQEVEGQSHADWVDAISSFVRDKTAGGPRAAGVTEIADRAGPETLGQTLRSGLRRTGIEGWPFLGVALIGGLTLLGAGLAWLAVPAEEPADEELEHATVMLTLASDRPVILVSAEVAEQLYDVSDVDPAPNSPLLPSIRLAARVGEPGGKAAAEAQPLSMPAIRLSPIAGQSILKGDLAAFKAASARPELAAYKSLALELEGGGSKNPDELLTFGPMKIRRHLVEKIVRAVRTTSMDPVLLMAIADKESSFQTEAQAQTSSATGLFQFIERTWLGVVREFGPRHGLAGEARIVLAGEIAPAERARILALRRDAYLSAVLAAEMLKRDSERIGRKLGRALTGGEVYLVHFLGPDGAERLLERVTNAPTAVAAELLPRPAEANKSIFYAKGGDDGGVKGLSVAEVHGKFETMMSSRLDRYRAVKGAAATSEKNPKPGRP